ncbi:DMT family transporter [Sporomusa ovata]|uniref:DMT family transporter n=1 Tax=Sporomusa ovata TaxID=2378 RepID=UPI001F2BDD45|nr:DMT family transporter [Sporomusa ovata]
MSLTLTALLWGGNSVTAKYVVSQIEPMTAVFLRFSGITFLLICLTLYQEGKKGIPNLVQWPSIIAMGAFGLFINNALQFIGLSYTSAVNCSLISATTPAMTASFTSFFMNAKLTGQQWLGVAASLFGVLLIISKGSLSAISSLNINYGDILIFFSQVSWAFYSIKGRSVMKTFSPIATTAWTGLVGTILFFLFAVWYGFDGEVNLNSYGWFSMIYMILGSGILAFCWWNQGIVAIGPNRTTIFTNIIPLSGMCFATFFLHESINWSQLTGAACIIIGICMTSLTSHWDFWHRH